MDFRQIFPALTLFCLLGGLGGCGITQKTHPWVDLSSVNQKIEKKANQRTVLEAAEEVPAKSAKPRAKDLSATQNGHNEYLGVLLNNLPPETAQEEDKREGILLNFDNADIYEFIQVIAEALGINYIVDPQVKGVVNIRSGKKISKDNLYVIFKKILNINGVDISQEGDYFYIYPSKTPSPQAIYEPGQVGSLKDSARMVLQVVPVMHLPAAEAAKLVQPYLSEHGTIYTLEAQNTIILQDFESEVINALRVLAQLDISPLASLKVRLVRVEQAPLFDLRDELLEIFTALGINQKGFEGVSVLPLERVNSILLVSKSGFLLDSADKWVRELDVVPSEGRDNIYIYNVRNSVASELADLVNALISGDSKSKTTSAGKDKKSTTPKSTRPASRKPKAKAADNKGLSSLRFAGEPILLADDTRNIILIRALQPDYSRLSKLLERLDNLPRQVLIEVLVAEVRLSDSWELGIEWALRNNKLKIDTSSYSQHFSTSFTDVVENAPGGFTYSILRGGGDVAGLLNAIASVNDVSVLSSPHLLVLNNEEAMVNVGDQVPIITTETDRTGTDIPTVDKTVQYRDTGTILTVTPRINYNGVIILEVDQQVSQASENKLGGTTSPIISTREIKTKLAVKDGQSILMGGLIQKGKTANQNKVPLLGDIPLLGWLFKYEKNETAKTELLVMITPYVIESEDVLDQYIREFKEKMSEVRKKFAIKPDKE